MITITISEHKLHVLVPNLRLHPPTPRPLTHLIKVPGIGHEGTGEQHVTTNSGHLTLESLTTSVPSLPLITKAA